VEHLGWCDGCGSTFSSGDVVLTIGGRDGWSDAPDPETTHCFSCVTMAYEAMKAAQG
jgi:hypothetical protein